MFFVSIAIIVLLSAMSPGPDFAIVSHNAMCHGKRGGFWSAAGIAVAILVHGTYLVAGLGVVISHSLVLFSIIKYVGAAYLVFLGVKLLRAKRQDPTLNDHANHKRVSSARIFYQGFLCNLLNIKAILFFLALFTLVVKPEMSVWVRASAGLESALVALLWFMALTVMLNHKHVRRKLQKAQFYITRTLGGVLVLAGVGLLFVRRL
jgi:RhtB (resistance to homoserine/threonine) family protein